MPEHPNGSFRDPGAKAGSLRAIPRRALAAATSVNANVATRSLPPDIAEQAILPYSTTGGALASTHLLLGLIGLATGLAASTPLSRFLKGPFGVSITDAANLVVVAVFLAFVAFLACYIPARRAMHVCPMVAVTHDRRPNKS